MDILGRPHDQLRLRDSNIGSIELRPGGVGRNVAERVRRLGADCTLLTVFGNDALADALRGSCSGMDIDISHALTVTGRTSVYLAVHDETGDMLTAVNDMAIAASLTPAYARECLPVIDTADICVLDANPPAETLRLIAEQAKAPLLMDPVSCAKIERVRPLLPFLAAIKPNILEAQSLTGCNDARDCAAKLVQLGVKRVFVSLGEEGLCCADARMCTVLPVQKLSCSPKTGAGDALCAGLAVALAKGMDTLESAQFGMQCAADYLNEEK